MDNNKDAAVNIGEPLEDEDLADVSGGSAAAGGRSEQCPTCKQWFDTSSRSAREVFRTHKLQCKKDNEYSPYKS